MSLRGRRIARRERRDLARRAKLAKLSQGTTLRVRPGWAVIIQALAFVRKELGEILRQPRLLLLLVFGPFVLLLLFGAGYQNATIGLRTEFVGPPGSLYEQAVNDYTDQVGDYIDPMGFTNDIDAATERLDDEQLDVVVVFPTDALDQILSGESATIRGAPREARSLPADGDRHRVEARRAGGQRLDSRCHRGRGAGRARSCRRGGECVDGTRRIVGGRRGHR